MGWKVKNFECQDCGHEWEELFKDGDEIVCPECESKNTKALLSAPGLGRFSMADADGKKDILRKRSEEHTKKKAMKDWREKNREKNR